MPIANQAYVRDLGRCFGAIYFPGETYAWYLNTKDPIGDPDFANFDFNIRRVGEQGFAAVNAGKLVQDPYPDNTYRIKCNFVFPDLIFGWYEFVIYDRVNLIEKAVSNPVQVEERSLVKNSVRIFYRNDENIHGFNYEGDPDFYNIFTLPLIQIGFAFDLERKQYRNVTDRRITNYNVSKDEVFKLESYYFDESGHRAMSSVFDDHNEIFINYTFIMPKTAYSFNENYLSAVSKGSVEVIPIYDVKNPNSNLIPQPSPLIDAILEIYRIRGEDENPILGEDGGYIYFEDADIKPDDVVIPVPIVSTMNGYLIDDEGNFVLDENNNKILINI